MKRKRGRNAGGLDIQIAQELRATGRMKPRPITAVPKTELDPKIFDVSFEHRCTHIKNYTWSVALKHKPTGFSVYVSGNNRLETLQDARNCMQDLLKTTDTENDAALASWQCIHTDGVTGITSDEHGNQFCAKDAKIAARDAEIVRLRTALRDVLDAWSTDLNTENYDNGDDALRLRDEMLYVHHKASKALETKL